MNASRRKAAAFLFLALLMLSVLLPAIRAEEPEKQIENRLPALSESLWLRIADAPRGSRVAIQSDPVLKHYLDMVFGLAQWNEVSALPGDLQPEFISADADTGRLEPSRPGYFWTTIRVENETAAVMDVRGASYVFLNAEPHIGNPYGFGYVQLPVRLREGLNHVLLRARGGQCSLTLKPVSESLYWIEGDATLPDVREGFPLNAPAALPLANATGQARNVRLRVMENEWFSSTESDGWVLAPYSLAKMPFSLKLRRPIDRSDNVSSIPLKVIAESDGLEAICTLNLRVRAPQETYKVTFLSRMDGSAQYFAVRPPSMAAPPTEDAQFAMLFSLHGASVEAIGQADSYSSKSWAYVVAPTNRRPYGFDWEDWGREDAMEVLDLALDILPVDPNRVYLVGHSMGGHGTWNIAANRPGLFAAIAPSAGWASFYSYGDKPRNDPDHPLYRIFHLCSGPSDTLALAGNLEQLPTFVLHGGADDNVPVSEAQTMVQALQKQNPALVYREIPGKGHWWDESPEPGADCLDLREMIDYLGRHRRHPAPRQVDFVTRALWASRQCRWVTILAQSLAGEASHIVATAFPGLQTFEVQVDNIRAFEIDPESLLPGRPCEITLKIEGQDLEIPWSGTGPVAAEYDESRDRWVPGKKIITMEDQRLESGYAPLKAAMFEPFALVYPTGGAPEERNAFTARARFDAENWWYRGNGYAPLLSDQEFLDAPAGRNPVLFGNSGINRAWDACLEPGPICVNGKSVKIGPLTLSDDSTALVGQYPHRSEDKRMVFVVAGNSPEAAMLTVLVPYFVSGVGLPDFLAFGEQSWLEGVEGAVATGFFGPKWEWIEKATYIRSGAVGEEDAPTN